MCVFKRLDLSGGFEGFSGLSGGGGFGVVKKCNINLCYILEIYDLFRRHGRHLCDDFAQVRREGSILSVMELIARYEPYFWVVLTKKGGFMGFVYLYDVIGDSGGFDGFNGRGGIENGRGFEGRGSFENGSGFRAYSAAVTVCFKREFWGRYVKFALKKFKKYCFGRLGLARVKAEVFSSNARVKGILKALGFECEGVLRGETLCGGKPADVEVWGLNKGD